MSSQIVYISTFELILNFLNFRSWMSWRDGDFDPHGGRNAFRLTDESKQSSSERAASMRAMRSFTQSIEDEGPPELPASLDIDMIEGVSMKTSDTNDTIIEVKPGKLDPQLGETQKYKMAVPGPGHSEQEQELHKSLIRDEEDDAEVEQIFAGSAEPVVTPPKSLNFAETAEELRHAYDQKIRKRPTTPTSACVLDGIAFFAGSVDGNNDSVPTDAEKKIKVSIPSSRRRKTENMSYSEFYESMANQIPGGGGRRMSQSGRTTPLHDYEGDILDENPQYKDKAPPAPVVHRRSSIEWENFADMEEKMEQAEEKARAEEKKEKEEAEETAKNDDITTKEAEKTKKKLGFHAKPPTVEITSPDAPHQGAFHDNTPKEPKVVEEEEDDDLPTFSEDMDEARQQIKKVMTESMVDSEGVEEQKAEDVISSEYQPQVSEKLSEDIPAEGTPAESSYQQEGQEAAYDPNAYPGYIWNYETQEWEYDPNYVASEGTYDQSGLEAQAAAYAEYDQNAAAATYEQEHAGYDQSDYQSYQDSTYPAQAYEGQAQAYHDQQAYGTETAAVDPSQEYDYSAYGGYEGYLAACKAYEEANGQQQYGETTAATDAAYFQGYGYEQQGDYHHEGVGATDETTTSTSGYEQSNGENAYAGYGDSYQGYDGYDQNAAYYQGQEYQQAAYQGQEYDYSQYQTEQQPTEAPPRPVAPIEPLFKQEPQQPDPFGWDTTGHAQEAAPPIQEISPTPQDSTTSAPATSPARLPPARPEAPKKPEEVTADAAAPPRPPPAARPPPPRPAPAKKEEPKEPEPEEDAWAQFKRMTEKVSSAVKTTESTLKNLEETSAANDIKDESYLANVGGSQGFVNESTQKEIQRLTEEKKMEKMQKKKLKQQGKKAASPTYDPDEEDAMDRAAQELAMKMASMRTDMDDWKAPEMIPVKEIKKAPEIRRVDSASAIPPRKRSSIKDVQQDSGGSLELPAHLADQGCVAPNPKGDHAPDDPILSAPAWADFESSEPMLPPSESGFFSNKDASNEGGVARDASDDPFVTTTVSSEKRASFAADPFAPQQSALIDESYDPFAVVAVEEVVAMAKAKAEQAAANAENDDDFYNGRQSPTLSTPTPEGGSPISQRPNAFEDDFKCEELTGLDTPTPLYDEDDSQPLTDFIPKYDGDGWDLMVRHPIKKKSFMAERCWKPCYVRLHGLTLYVYNDKKDAQPLQELLLQATYSLSDTTLQAYDVYGKIHTVKLQFVVYKEKVGIRPGQISRLVDGHITKYGLPLEHSAQCTVLLKFGSLNAAHLQSFVTTVEDLLFKCKITRTAKPTYKQDEVQIHCYDEYSAFVDKDGVLSDQRARVRLFCLAFLTGSPLLEVGLNDRRRQGKEIVRRKDILPMYTERWIRFEALEFHSIVNKPEFDKEQVISFSPPDGCFFEIMRFRVRPPRNREKAMTVKAIMKIAGSKVEIRLEAMAAAQIQRTRGSDERRNIPCEDIAIRFPIPEAWIYLFREERHWGVGSIHSKKLRPGKVKNLKDRLLGAVQASEPNLIECAIGEAKYEHVYRSLVWRIPRLPEKHHAAYKSHLLKCRFELSSFDLMPEEFLPRCDVDFTMPLATVSNTVVRSVSVEQHEDSDRVEKFVRYVAKYQYKVEIDYVQCADLDLDMADPSVNPEAAAAPVPELHQPTFNPSTQSSDAQQGYRIDFNEAEMGGSNRHDDSSSDDEPDSHKMPIIQIDMKNYGY
uniref:Protein stoned-B n=2 Tax=Caenorhabditis tropicalis TaxID=1561998 RepID=A0A1I7U817_9PELO